MVLTTRDFEQGSRMNERGVILPDIGELENMRRVQLWKKAISEGYLTSDMPTPTKEDLIRILSGPKLMQVEEDRLQALKDTYMRLRQPNLRSLVGMFAKEAGIKDFKTDPKWSKEECIEQLMELGVQAPDEEDEEIVETIVKSSESKPLTDAPVKVNNDS